MMRTAWCGLRGARCRTACRQNSWVAARRPGTSADVPGRCCADAVSIPGSGSGGDRVGGRLGLLAQGVGQRRGAGRLGRSRLAVLADDVPGERLDQVGGLLVLVLDAADQVADQDDRVLV